MEQQNSDNTSSRSHPKPKTQLLQRQSVQSQTGSSQPSPGPASSTNRSSTERGSTEDLSRKQTSLDRRNASLEIIQDALAHNPSHSVRRHHRSHSSKAQGEKKKKRKTRRKSTPCNKIPEDDLESIIRKRIKENLDTYQIRYAPKIRSFIFLSSPFRRIPN